MTDLASFIDAHEVVDVHEHHMPEVLANREVDLLQLFRQSYAGWTQARPYPLPSEARDEDPMLAAAAPTRWETLRPFLIDSASNMFVRNLVRALEALYDLPPDGLNEATWESVNQQVIQNHQNASWLDTVLDRAKIRHIITDPYSAPLQDTRETLGPRYSSVIRMNAFACGWHPDSADHNGNRAHQLLEQLGLGAGNFKEYLDSTERFVTHHRVASHLAIKNALAYDRFLDVGPANPAQAQSAWGKADPTPAEKKAFGDFIMHRFCELCAANDIPMQMHLGTALIRGSHPMNVAGLVEAHPQTRFLLMHLAYPWSRDLLGMAFVYRNIWLDLTWSALLSPSHFKLALHEGLEVLPDDSRMMFGGDNWHVEETYGTVQTFKQLIAEVLNEKVRSHYFSEAHARRLAARILTDNAHTFFGL